MRLYHGTVSTGAENIIKNGIKLERGKLKVDFGQGFYTTTSLNFAKNTAMNKARKTNSYNNQIYVEPYVLTYQFDQEKANKQCKILTFSKTDIKWAQFIINNRNGHDYMNKAGTHFHNINHKYDIVKGAIADNEIVLLAKTLKSLNTKATDEDINNMLYNYFTRQISFHTYKSLDCLHLTQCDIIKERKGDVVNE